MPDLLLVIILVSFKKGYMRHFRFGIQGYSSENSNSSVCKLERHHRVQPRCRRSVSRGTHIWWFLLRLILFFHRDVRVYQLSQGKVTRKCFCHLQIVSIKGDEVFRVNLVLYNGATDGENYSDMSKSDISVQFESGCMNVVFLNKFVNDILVI